ncbi:MULTISPECIES: SHOCT domain-containing protein [unclassified Streptosporangium]|uniref:SHOCT domain-containing protein n=1 Tax=unclassified Streptosporangium TaxID=2632669 RepID=UPI002E29AB61|nr:MULTISPECIES: SHOCT domain-containing protein [unclassified Streptosporangium]
MSRILVLFFVIAVIAVVVLGVTLLVRASAARASAARASVADNPREILKRRYAAGEIDEDEYLRRMSGLSQDW